MKKLLCIILAVALLFPMAIHAESGYNDSQIQALLAKLNIMVGDQNGNFNPDNLVTRGEFTKIAIMASPYYNAVPATSSTSPFGDVPFTLWSAPYIVLGVQNGYITGYPDSTFRPENPVLLEEGVTICLKLLGYSSADYGTVWPAGPMALAENLELLDNVNKSAGQNLQRKDVMHLIYNTLRTKIKNSNTELINGLSYAYLEDTVLLATQAQDNSIAKNKIATSAGTYKIGKDIDLSLLGKKGDAFIKNGDTLEVFIPQNQSENAHAVYAVVGEDLVIYKNGSTEILSLPTDLICYSGQKAGTVGTFLSAIKMGDTVKVVYDQEGDMDYLLHTDDDLQGPFTVYNENWMAQNGIASHAAIIRNGKTVSSAAVEKYDLVYYSKDMNLVWTYSQSITGTFEKAIPNQDAPTSVVISGNTLQIETATAFSKLSSNGGLQLGDSVTVLLGRNGGIADAVTGDQATVQYGLLTETGTRAFTTQTGNTEHSYYAKIVTAAGEALEFKVDKNYSDYKNKLVSISVQNGTAKIHGVTEYNGSGTFRYSTMQFNGETVSDTVKILDVLYYGDPSKTAVYHSVYPQRLDSANLRKGDVLFVTYNSNREIDSIFLDDITGDGVAYGVVTKAEKNSASMMVSATYHITVDGNEQVYNSNSVYPADKGDAVQAVMRNGVITDITTLYKISKSVKSIDNQYLYTATGEKYTLGDNVAVYRHTINKSDYMLIDLKDLDITQGDVAYYYNNTLGAGGRIRVIIQTIR